MPDDHSEVVPLLPIPNRTVKRLSADDSAGSRVKVGHRQALTAPNSPAPQKAGLFAFFGADRRVGVPAGGHGLCDNHAISYRSIPMSAVWSRRARWVALSAVVAFAAGCASTSQPPVAEPVKVKVFVGAMFEIGKNTG